MKEYVEEHPEASVTEVAKALGVSRTTVYKYLKPLQAAKPFELEADYLFKALDGQKDMNVEVLCENDHEKLHGRRREMYEKYLSNLKASKMTEGEEGE